MIAVEVSTRAATAAEHLRLMQSLGRELERAMAAIARNDVAELEDSIAHQELLSAALGDLAVRLSAPVQPSPTADVVDEDLSRQIRHAVADLQKLNLRYSILLQHSSRSIAQMVSLFSSVCGEFRKEAGPRLKRHSWPGQMQSSWEA